MTADLYPEYVEDAISAFLNQNAAAGARVLKPIAYRPRAIVRQPLPSQHQRAQVWLRDRFQCRYCSRKTVFEWVMALLASVYPDFFPWHPNWKTGSTHPAIYLWSAMVDHVVPAAQGGGNDLANLVTACNPCNLAKAYFSLDEIGWSLKSVASDDWDGLLGYYQPLWERLDRPNPKLHAGWLRAFGFTVSLRDEVAG